MEVGAGREVGGDLGGRSSPEPSGRVVACKSMPMRTPITSIMRGSFRALEN